MKIRRVLYGVTIGVLLLLVLILDVIRKSVELDITGLGFIRDVMIIGVLGLVFLVLEAAGRNREDSPVKRMGAVLVVSVIMIVVGIGGSFMVGNGFDSKNSMLLPLDYGTLFTATILGVAFGVFAVVMIRFLRDLALYKMRKGARRNFLVFIGLTFATAASTLWLRPLEREIYVSILYGLAVIFAIVNSFRLSWIVYLSKREKMFGLVYGFFLFAAFIVLNILIQSGSVSKALLYYSYPVKEFASLVSV
ncbi:MAG: hypothetical protein AAB393_09420, partial [Bacteroidota bacterium]